ncbi:MAG: metallophosphoesterase [Candidatus Bathyarchaeia archaeon]
MKNPASTEIADPEMRGGGEWMKIGVFADTHVGRCIPRAIGELRRQAYRHAFTESVSTFIKEGVDYLVHAGDIFEKRSMTPAESLFVKDELQRLVDSTSEVHSKHVKIFMVRGNHDGTVESNALDYIKHPLAGYLKIIGDETLQDRDEAVVDDSLILTGISYHPYIARKFEEVKPRIKRLFKDKSRLKILLLHNFIKGHHEIPPGVPQHNCLDLAGLEDLGANLIVAGHHHTRKVSVTRYGTLVLTPGATEAIDLSDEGSYGVYILEGRDLRFIPLKPLHKIHNIRVDSGQAARPAEWFVENAAEEVSGYVSTSQAEGADSILRILLLGLTDGDPYGIECSVRTRLERITKDTSRILYVDVVNRVEEARRQVIQMSSSGAWAAPEILMQLGRMSGEAAKIVEEVSMMLDERASQTTGLLTASDRSPFVNRWIRILEEVDAQV